MHHPQSQHAQSLYFDYPRYPFVRPPEMDGEQSRYPVVIVGGGPVGLCSALELAKHGVRSVVLEEDETVSEGSRALSISRRSFEILQQLDLSERFLEKALPWTSGKSFYRGKVVFELEMPHTDDERFFPMVNLQQCYIERFMVEQITEQDAAELRWHSKVIAVVLRNDAVELRVDTPEGEYTLEAKYVIAADGARSALRRLLGLRMSGTSFQGEYLIADIKLSTARPTERLVWFDPATNPGSTVLMHKQPDGMWRVDYQLQPGYDPEVELDEANIRSRIQEQLDLISEPGPWELDWFSLYKAHCLCLDDYRVGRVLFVGDAAHLVPIFGVRGLNSGFADANNLGWKLACVLKGQAASGLLDSYSSERREDTQETFRQAGKSTAFMTPPSRGCRLLRDAVLSLSLSESFARGLINPRQSAPFAYLESPLNSGEVDAVFEQGPRTGAPLQNVRICSGGQSERGTFLLDHLGVGFTLLYFTEEGPLPEDIAHTVHSMRRSQAPLDHLVISRRSANNKAVGWLADPEGRVFEKYGASHGTGYLVRPDAHVAARWMRVSGKGVQAALARIVRTTD